MKASIDKLADTGFLPDPPDMALPAGSWTDSRNVRYRDGAVEKVRGYDQALGDLSATAIWASPISDGTNYYWAYGSGTVMYATDGSTHADIAGTITLGATDDLGYSGGPFHGHLIVNDGTSIPQSWNPSLSNNLISLTAWPSVTLTCRVMRPFKDFLFAFRVTDASGYNPRLMRWSDRAAQGALPLSWDFTDPTNQAGINELGQTTDHIVDSLALRDSLIIYKEYHTWTADYIGGQDIFSFRQVFSQLGMLTENCAAVFGSQHVVLSDNDLVLHNGNDAQSLADRRTRRWLFNRINSNRFKRSFLVADYRNREVLVCFPESGYDWPNLALAWNWADNTFDVRELGGPKTFATTGIIPGTTISFDSDSGSFDSATGTFDEETYNPFLTRVLFLDSAANRAYQNDTGEDFNGVPMTCYAERSSIAITKDLQMLKRVRRIIPKVIGTAGDTLRFYIGTRDKQNTATQWRGPYTYTIGTDYKVDFRVTARVLDLRVEYSGANTFRLYGFDVEHDPMGYR